MPGGREIFSFQKNPFEYELFKILECKVCVSVRIFKEKKLRREFVFVYIDPVEKGLKI
jgi:hypothetical protein